MEPSFFSGACGAPAFSADVMSASATPSTDRATVSSAASGPVRWMVRWTCDRLAPGASAAAGDDDSSS